MAKSLAGRELPALDNRLSTEEKRIEYIKNHISTQYYLIRTAALGQVVDTKLKVKGVNGLRVIDASIFPGHVSGNIMSTTYAVAEKGADLIKADISWEAAREVFHGAEETTSCWVELNLNFCTICFMYLQQIYTALSLFIPES